METSSGREDKMSLLLKQVNLEPNRKKRRACLVDIKKELEQQKYVNLGTFIEGLSDIATCDESESCREVAAHCVLSSVSSCQFVKEDIKQATKLIICIRHRLAGLEESEVVNELLISVIEQLLLKVLVKEEDIDLSSCFLISLEDLVKIAILAIDQKPPDLKLMGCRIVEMLVKIFGINLNFQNQKLMKCLMSNLEHSQGKVRKGSLQALGSLVSIDPFLLEHLLGEDFQKFLLLLADQNVQVRIEFVKNLSSWYRDFDNYRQRLLPFLLMSSTDEYPDVRDVADIKLAVQYDPHDVTYVLKTAESLVNDWKPSTRDLGARCLLALLVTRKLSLSQDDVIRIMEIVRFISDDEALLKYVKAILVELRHPADVITVLRYLEKSEEFDWHSTFVISNKIDTMKNFDQDSKKVIMKIVLEQLEKNKKHIFGSKQCHLNVVSIFKTLSSNIVGEEKNCFNLVEMLLDFSSVFEKSEADSSLTDCLQQTIDSFFEIDYRIQFYSTYLKSLLSKDVEKIKILSQIVTLACLNDSSLRTVLPTLEPILLETLKSVKLEFKISSLVALEALLEISSDNTYFDSDVLSRLINDGILPILEWEKSVLAQKVRTCAARCLVMAVPFSSINLDLLFHRLIEGLEDDSAEVRIQILQLLRTRKVSEDVSDERKVSLIKAVVARLDDKSAEVRVLAASTIGLLVGSRADLDIEEQLRKMTLFLNDKDSKTRTAVANCLTEIGKQRKVELP